MVTDSKMLRDEIVKSGFKYSYIAKNLNLSTYGLQKKIDNETEFKASEICKLTTLLSLSKEKRDQIFLT